MHVFQTQSNKKGCVFILPKEIKHIGAPGFIVFCFLLMFNAIYNFSNLPKAIRENLLIALKQGQKEILLSYLIIAVGLTILTIIAIIFAQNVKLTFKQIVLSVALGFISPWILLPLVILSDPILCILFSIFFVLSIILEPFYYAFSRRYFK